MKDERKTKAQLLAELRELRGQVEGFQKTRAERAPLLGILDSTTDYVAIANQDGQVTFVNRGGRRLIGLGDDEDLSGLKIADTHPPWASELVLNEGLPTALRDGTWRGETALLRHDGVEIPVSQLIMAHRSPDGQVAFFSTIMRDMSEAKRAERERLAHLRMLEALDRINRAIQGTDDLDQMMSDVLDATLAIFGADRAWLLFPCDPDAPTWQVPMERTVPEYPSAIILGAEMTMEPGLARVQRQLLESEASIRLVPAFDGPLAEAEVKPHGFLSNMAMAIHPKVGSPWMFGIHQCSHPREWTDEESRIFQQIGHRVADALTSLLTRRDLQESEERYRDLIEQEKDIIYTLDLSGKITFASPAVTEILGYLPEELIGRPFAELIPEERRPQAEADFLKVLATGETTSETVLLDKDLQPRVVEFSSTAIKQGEQPIGARGIARDITARKRAEQERLAHVRMLEGLDRVNRAIGGTDDLDQMMSDVLDTALAIFEADQAWLQFPCDPDSPTWQVPMMRTVPEYSAPIALGVEIPAEPEFAEMMRRFLESDAPLVMSPEPDDPWLADFAEKYGFKSSFAMAIHPKVGPAWVFGVHQCSHPRVWTEEESRILQQIGRRVADALTSLLTRRHQRESEEKFRELVERAQDGIVIVHHDLVEYVNPAYSQLMGYEPEELAGKTFTFLIDPPERDKIVDRYRRRMAGEDVPHVYETRLVHKDGQVIEVEFNATTVNYQGETASLTMVRDITERKRSERERLAHLRMLEALDRVNRAIGDTDDLDQMMSDVLDATLSVFGADRAWVQFPCDPDAPTWQVPMLRTVPEYSDPIPQGVEIPADPEFGDLMRVFLESDAPIGLLAEADDPYLREFGEKYGIRSSLCMAIHPKVGPAWLFGVHQCSHPRVWTEEESRILEQIGHRMADALTSLLTHRDLAESEEKFRELVERAQDGIVIISRGQIVYVNPAFLQMVGQASEDLTDRGLGRFIHPQERDKVIDRYRRRVAGEDVPSIYETRLIHTDGRSIDVEFNAAMFNYQGERATLTIVRDITDRKRAEEALRDSERRYRELFNSISDFIYTHDLEGHFQALNPVAAESLGYTVDEVLGRNIVEFMPETDRAGLKDGYLDRITDQGRADGTLVLIAQDGTERYLEYGSVLVRPDSGPAYVSGAARDVTERVLAEREVKKLEQQLVQAQKMEAIGRLAGGVAHDFNNLLSVINGYSELLLRRLEPEDPKVKDLEQIKKAGFRAADLTNQLLAFSRRQVIKPQVLDLNRVVTGVEKMLQRLIGEHIDLSTSLPADLGSVRADPGQVEQVIMNLVVNARDAMPKGGVLTIQTDNVYLDEEYFRGQLEAVPGPHVMLAVSDTGQGMDEQTRAQAFEPFFTTKAKGEGTGLGLATVYGIVKQSDGHIAVYSEPGQGTTFKIFLPRGDEAAEDVRRETAQEIPTHGSETVLLVEDDDLVRQLAAEVLKGKGYQVITAINGHDAMTSCQSLAGSIDLLVTDVVMPGMSGRELVEQATKMCPDLKVLYMSGYTDEIIARHGVLEEGVNLISKPFSVEALARKVRLILDA